MIVLYKTDVSVTLLTVLNKTDIIDTVDSSELDWDTGDTSDIMVALLT